MLGVSDWCSERPVGESSQVVLYVRVQDAEHGGWLPAYHTMYSLAANRSRTSRAVANFPTGRFATLMASKYWRHIGMPKSVGHGVISVRHVLQQVCHFKVVGRLIYISLLTVVSCCEALLPICIVGALGR